MSNAGGRYADSQPVQAPAVTRPSAVILRGGHIRGEEGTSVSNRRKRHIYPDIPEALPHPIVDNHTHMPVRGEQHPEDYGVVEDGDKPQPLNAAGIVERMAAANVRHAITCGCEIPTLAPTVELAERFPGQVSAAIAIHPNDAPLHCGITDEAPDGLAHGLDPWHREYSLEDAVNMVADLARSNAVVAIGETGLDYFRTAEAGKAAQIESFKMHIDLAKQLDLPLQIHDREAHEDCIRVLREVGAPERTVFHCFSGDEDMARICAEEGWYASFAGPITYPANEFLRRAFLAMPEELILVETDAPYLTPVPWRGHPNAAYASAYTARFQAELRGVSLESWCERLDANTRDVYGV
ncbi:TatD family hydrolase [Arcanobacterium haemolyticum]|nr:TatD family hydrolase [Arcanobacterium haemolyticum]